MPHCLLEDLGTLKIRGADTRTFLQGQLSNDVERLSTQAVLRAGLHNPQGRTLALLALLETADAEVLAILPRALAATVAAQLKRYVLRSRVAISDDSTAFRIYGLQGSEAPSIGTGQVCGYGLPNDPRRLLLQNAAGALWPATMAREAWHALDIAAGLPTVSNEISGQFVAQMLNLDCIDAISFAKGCYTGQEVIARARYRGHVKRRLQRFVTPAAHSLVVGASGRLSDGRRFRVVDTVTHTDGRSEFLAVAPLVSAVSESEDKVAASEEPVLAASALALPYALPA
jgi:tRNA-modifying protein YgfZ